MNCYSAPYLDFQDGIYGAGFHFCFGIPGLTPGAITCRTLRGLPPSFFTRGAGEVFIGIERADCRPALIVAGKDLNATFSFVQTLLARARELHALLKKLEAFFQRQIATLKLAHNSLEFFQRGFKVLRVILFHFKLPSLTLRLLTRSLWRRAR